MTRLASLVSVDATALAAVGALDDPGFDAARLAVDDWTQRHEAMRLEAGPELALVRSWLLHNAPETPRRVLVHGDFEPGNVLVRAHEVAALLDWETDHLGSPLEVLGWVTNPDRHRQTLTAGHSGGGRV